jgi:hypothetical protein
VTSRVSNTTLLPIRPMAYKSFACLLEAITSPLTCRNLDQPTSRDRRAKSQRKKILCLTKRDLSQNGIARMARNSIFDQPCYGLIAKTAAWRPGVNVGRHTKSMIIILV